ncbi:MAG: stage III sporulation protein AE [Lachnospiraceae bacterium]|nr:stage III sporulation protein AE [Lachnospiraceae bacterium]
MVLLLVLLGVGMAGRIPAQGASLETEAMAEEEKARWEDTLLNEVNLDGAQQSLNELLGQEKFSIEDAVKDLLQGKIPWSLDSLKQIVQKTLLGEIQTYRKTAAYLLVLIVVSAVFSNFVAVFDQGQIADISYYMMYLLMVTLLMKVFSVMSGVAAGAVSAILQFMQALLPACLMTVFLSSGSVSAFGFYQITLLAITGVQWLMNSLLLPAVQVYVILLFINQMMKEDYLSHMADLLKRVILWSLKSGMAVLFGMQAIQCMIAPAVDQLKTSVLSKAVTAIPGIGGAYETVTETVLGSAVLLKNAVGIAGMAALFLVGLIPAVKLVCGVLLYRLLGAVAQPVTDKRVAECISSVAEGGEILLKIVVDAGILFLVSLAMIAVIIRA